MTKISEVSQVRLGKLIFRRVLRYMFKFIDQCLLTQIENQSIISNNRQIGGTNERKKERTRIGEMDLRAYNRREVSWFVSDREREGI